MINITTAMRDMDLDRFFPLDLAEFWEGLTALIDIGARLWSVLTEIDVSSEYCLIFCSPLKTSMVAFQKIISRLEDNRFAFTFVSLSLATLVSAYQ